MFLHINFISPMMDKLYQTSVCLAALDCCIILATDFYDTSGEGVWHCGLTLDVNHIIDGAPMFMVKVKATKWTERV